MKPPKRRCRCGTAVLTEAGDWADGATLVEDTGEVLCKKCIEWVFREVLATTDPTPGKGNLE